MKTIPRLRPKLIRPEFAFRCRLCNHRILPVRETTEPICFSCAAKAIEDLFPGKYSAEAVGDFLTFAQIPLVPLRLRIRSSRFVPHEQIHQAKYVPFLPVKAKRIPGRKTPGDSSSGTP